MSAIFFEYGKSGKALKDSIARQRKYLQEQVDQSVKNQEYVKDFAATQGQIVTPTKFERPLEEQLADVNLQRRKAFDSVQMIIKDPREATKVIDGLDAGEIQLFNRYAPAIVSDVNKQFGNVTSQFLLQYIDQYIAKQLKADNLLKFYNPDTVADTINREDNFYTKKGEIKPSKYAPYKGKLTEKFIMDLTPATVDGTEEALTQHLILLDSVRDRIIDDIRKLTQKRGQVNDIKIAELSDFLDIIETSHIPNTYMLIDTVTGREDRFEDRATREARFDRPMSQDPDYSFLFSDEGEEPEPQSLEKTMSATELRRARRAIAAQQAEEEEGEFQFEGMGLSRILKKPTVSNARQSLGVTRVVKGMKPVYGRGVVLTTPVSDKYAPFGRYSIHYPHLEQNHLNIRFKSTAQLTDPILKRKVKISDALKEVLLDLVDRQTISRSKVEALPEEDKKLFNYVMKVTKLAAQFEIAPTAGGEVQTQDEDEKRFKLLIGTLRAGNDSKEVVRQLVILLGKFISEGRIDQTSGNEILESLNL